MPLSKKTYVTELNMFYLFTCEDTLQKVEMLIKRALRIEEKQT